MTNKEKQTLTQDLCARLPYGVMILVEHDWYEDEVPPYDAPLTVEYHSILNNFSENPLTCCFIIKPYLRSMEDMTDEEVKEFYDVECIDAKVGYIKPTSNWHFTINGFDWLNKHHFDYRGLIEKELAIRVTKENNPYKN